MQLEATDLLLINRGDVNYKVTGAQLKDGSTVQPTDEIMVQRGSTLYRVSAATLTASLGVLQDTDFILVERGDELYSLHPSLLPALVPSVTLNINCAGLAQSAKALQIDFSGARAPSGYTAQIQFPDSPRLDTVFISGSGAPSFTVSQLGSGASRAIIYGAFNFIKFENSQAIVSL